MIKSDLGGKKKVLYKTEICRQFEERGFCKYEDKCRFAHSAKEMRCIERHPRYKTEICKTFWQAGSCPYGRRCCFIHGEIFYLLKIKNELNENVIKYINLFSSKSESGCYEIEMSSIDTEGRDESSDKLYGSSDKWCKSSDRLHGCIDKWLGCNKTRLKEKKRMLDFQFCGNMDAFDGKNSEKNDLVYSDKPNYISKNPYFVIGDKQTVKYSQQEINSNTIKNTCVPNEINVATPEFIMTTISMNSEYLPHEKAVNSKQEQINIPYLADFPKIIDQIIESNFTKELNDEFFASSTSIDPKPNTVESKSSLNLKNSWLSKSLNFTKKRSIWDANESDLWTANSLFYINKFNRNIGHGIIGEKSDSEYLEQKRVFEGINGDEK